MNEEKLKVPTDVVIMLDEDGNPTEDESKAVKIKTIKMSDGKIIYSKTEFVLK